MSMAAAFSSHARQCRPNDASGTSSEGISRPLALSTCVICIACSKKKKKHDDDPQCRKKTKYIIRIHIYIYVQNFGSKTIRSYQNNLSLTTTSSLEKFKSNLRKKQSLTPTKQDVCVYRNIQNYDIIPNGTAVVQ